MRDVLGHYGAIALATKAVDVFSADTLDLAAISARSLRHTRMGHTFGIGGRDLMVVFSAGTDFSTVDDVTPFIQDGADATTFAKIYTGPLIEGPNAGILIALPFPPKSRRYSRVGCTPASSGTFTAETVTAWLENGPDNDTPPVG